MDIFHKVRRTVKKYAMFKAGEKVVVGVSGGPDSTALLHVLDRLARDGGFDLIVAHLHHGLRAEATTEEAFVAGLARSLNRPFESHRVHVGQYSRQKKLSLEEAGRELRYTFFHDIATRHGASRIALGHHRGDLAETVLLNLVRGSGIDGLKGMLPVREGFVVRPLLCCTREEIVAFLREHKIPFITDPSNYSMSFLRNRIRHELMPLLKERFNPRMEESLARLAEIAAVENDFMKYAAGEVLSSIWTCGAEAAVVSIPPLRNLHPALQNRVIREILAVFSPGRRASLSHHVQAVRALMLGGRPNASVILSDGIMAVRRYNNVAFSRVTGGLREVMNDDTPAYAYHVSPPGEIRVVETGDRVHLSIIEGSPDLMYLSPRGDVAYMDWDLVVPPLTVRNMRPGDRFQPLGMKGTKKLKDFFIDEKIPVDKRRRIPLVVDGASIIWVGGLRIAERVRVHPGTSRVLKVEIV